MAKELHLTLTLIGFYGQDANQDTLMTHAVRLALTLGTSHNQYISAATGTIMDVYENILSLLGGTAR